MNGRQHKTLSCQCFVKTMAEVSKEAGQTSIAGPKIEEGDIPLLWENYTFKYDIGECSSAKYGSVFEKKTLNFTATPFYIHRNSAL